ncbi:SWIM zinc finger family protein [Derxia gummosa]|uniref:SWIM zinc finger family protein n=1 Tax=Derxia gummosa DSM 723 TaxID=1121388 RepID=A0A8B6X6M3_9BURK|nr:SWIM zinc finger family protein [Derxia gummosa]
MTPEQIRALAPDEASFKAGRGLAAPRLWLAPGRVEGGALWGEMQGSGSKPYQTVADPAAGTWRCTCPSRKQPCKHVIGLLLCAAEQAGHFTPAAPPEWVVAWTDARAARADRQREREAQKAETAAAPPSAASQARARQRIDRMRDGMALTDLWLHDRLREGLAGLRGQPARHWQEAIKRLIDAQAGGAATLLRRLRDAFDAPDWQARVADRLARLHLLARATARLDELPEALAHEVRATLGLALAQDEVRAQGEIVADVWDVIASTQEPDEELTVCRAWLLGRATGREALLLSFIVPRAPREGQDFVAGQCFEGELAFYPGTAGLRAVPRSQAAAAPAPLAALPAEPVAAALARFAARLGASPWIEQAPMRLADVLLAEADGQSWMVDAAGDALPVALGAARRDRLALVAAGSRMQVAGEWNGATFTPLSAWVAGERHHV